MNLHDSTFDYLMPTARQKSDMAIVRAMFASLAFDLDSILPEGADKTYVLRKLRECSMWANVCITREDDGSPRN